MTWRHLETPDFNPGSASCPAKRGLQSAGSPPAIVHVAPQRELYPAARLARDPGGLNPAARPAHDPLPGLQAGVSSPQAQERKGEVSPLLAVRWGSAAYTLLVLGGLGVALLLTALVAIGLGEEYIPPDHIIGMALQWLPLHPPHTWTDVEQVIIVDIRLPRIATAIVVGGALGVAGAAFQGLFRNPLADPGIVGTSAGAGLGAMIGLALPAQIVWLGFSQVTLLAFCGALTGMVLVYALARVGGRLPSTSLLLAGFAVSAVLNAASSLVMSLNDRLREMYHWLLGSLIDTTASHLMAATPLVAAGTIGLLALAGDLNVLLLGDEQSHYLGLNVTQRRALILVFGSLVTAVAVSLSGIIAFVGLVVPHLARLLFGANHRLLLPASFLLGAIFLLVADTLARLVLAPQELPVGVVTALIGAPWFLLLLRRKRGEYTF